jgi:hypothetical protein
MPSACPSVIGSSNNRAVRMTMNGGLAGDDIIVVNSCSEATNSSPVQGAAGVIGRRRANRPRSVPLAKAVGARVVQIAVGFAVDADGNMMA